MRRKIKFTGAFRHGDYVRVIAEQGKTKAIHVFSRDKLKLLGVDERTELRILLQSSVDRIVKFKPIDVEKVFKCKAKMEGYLCDVETRTVFYKLSKK